MDQPTDVRPEFVQHCESAINTNNSLYLLNDLFNQLHLNTHIPENSRDAFEHEDEVALSATQSMSEDEDEDEATQTQNEKEDEDEATQTPENSRDAFEATQTQESKDEFEGTQTPENSRDDDDDDDDMKTREIVIDKYWTQFIANGQTDANFVVNLHLMGVFATRIEYIYLDILYLYILQCLYNTSIRKRLER
eukprot:195697_1